MRRAAAGLAIAVACAVLPAHAGERFELKPTTGVVALERAAGIGRGISETPGEVIAIEGNGARWRVVLADKGLALLPAGDALPAPQLPADALPDGELTSGTTNIARAWLSGPTARYAHGVLGDAIEASTAVAELADGTTAHVTLGRDSVFEDRRARLVDLDGDGADEIVTVRSYLSAGAALVVIEAGRSKLVVAAETPVIGRANRWLNPAGAADYDGDGHIEIAYVQTPHIGGALKLFEYRDWHLTTDGEAEGFSNHAIGSRVQDQAATLDWNGDGIADLALPGPRQYSLRIVTFAGGTFRELAGIGHAERIATALRILVSPEGQRRAIAYGLADGTLVAITN